MSARDTLTAMRTFLGSACDDGVRRVRGVDRDEMAARLALLSLEPHVVGELERTWDATRASDLWSSLLASLVTRVEHDRGDVDAPIVIWDDLDDHGPSGRLLYYYLFALQIRELHEYYDELGVPLDVRASTVGALARHGETHYLKHATTGVDAGWWMVPLLRGDILQVGSLKFHRVHLEVGTLAPRPWLDAVTAQSMDEGLRAGDEAFGIHIPARIDLSASALDATFARARDVLARVWPCSTRRIATCQSWMMDDRLIPALGEGSRIVAFQRRFQLIEPYLEDTATALYFVFDVDTAVPGELRATSRLQRCVREVIEAGGAWRSRTGWLDLDESNEHGVGSERGRVA